jgi:hypothetical protein
MALLLFLPISEILVGTQQYVFKSRGVYQGADLVVNGIPVFIFVAIVMLLNLAIIFMYKNRLRQIRFLIFTILVSLGLFGLFYYFTFASFKDELVSFKFTVAFPIAACILDFLAIRAINKDEMLIRSADRIR